jgi:hypothetical protein
MYEGSGGMGADPKAGDPRGRSGAQVSGASVKQIDWSTLPAREAVNKLLEGLDDARHRKWVTVMLVPRSSATDEQLAQVAAYGIRGLGKRAQRRIAQDRSSKGERLATQLTLHIADLEHFALFLEGQGAAYLTPVTPCGRGLRTRSDHRYYSLW